MRKCIWLSIFTKQLCDVLALRCVYIFIYKMIQHVCRYMSYDSTWGGEGAHLEASSAC